MPRVTAEFIDERLPFDSWKKAPQRVQPRYDTWPLQRDGKEAGFLMAFYVPEGTCVVEVLGGKTVYSAAVGGAQYRRTEVRERTKRGAVIMAGRFIRAVVAGNAAPHPP